MNERDVSFEELYDTAPCGFISADALGVVVRVNQTLLTLTDFARDEVVGKPFIDLLSVGSQLFYETRYLSVLHLEGEVREVSLSFRRADGGQLPVLINAVLLRDSAGQPAATRVAVFDATERQDYERDLLAARRAAETSATRVSLLQDATTAFGVASDEHQLLDELVDIARRAFDARDVAVMVPSPHADLVVLSGTHPLDHALWGVAGRPEDTAFAESRMVSVSSRDEAEKLVQGLGEACRAARVESLTATPMINDDGPLGVFVSFFGRQREFDEQAAELQLALGRLAAQALTRIRMRHELERLAFYDQLTGLATRRLTRERLDSAVVRAQRSRSPVMIMFADLDGFKAINDSLGHSVGDEVLLEVADRIRSVLRESDLVARFGGDEFVAICEDTDEEAALRVTQRVLSTISAPLPGRAQKFNISASIGVAVYSPGDSAGVPPAVSTDELFEAADAAMYSSKGAGKDRVTVVSL
jgi:diguanylate cyclase (GGDEF)-like protein/PAS domain S-box-containing protein